jgi:hypothetical protein
MTDSGPARSSRAYYWGTLIPMAAGSIVAPSLLPEGSAEAELDAGRSARAGLRAKAVWAAASIRDATAIAAIRAYSRTAPVPHEALRVYHVDLQPFHLGPVAIIDELRARLETGVGGCEPLVRHYWMPDTTWHIQEFIAPSMTVLKEVPAGTERDVYIRRWVHYNQDRERAAAL